MLGPYCPIYGLSSIIMILYLNQYNDNIITVFLLAVFVCSIMEYIVSYLMEKLFNARWWDYSDRKFNINGRICLTNAFLFGLLGVFLIYIINPFLTILLLKIKNVFLNIICIIWLVIFVSDFIISMNVTYRLKNSIKKIKKDNTEENSKSVKEIIENKFFNRRIFNAFPKFKINIIEIKELMDLFEDKIEKK